MLQHYLAGIQFALGDLDADTTPELVTQRHARVAARREGVHIICHRGASEFAHENTLEAYRATFELGGDGNEIDIRMTKDEVLVCFHDDMLDRLTEAYGDVSDYTWEELQRFSFRSPGPFGDQSRIPALVEVLDLHRQYDGLLHLDIKQPGLDQAIGELLTLMDLWDHVAYCNVENSGGILRDPRLKLRRYKAPGLYLDRSGENTLRPAYPGLSEKVSDWMAGPISPHGETHPDPIERPSLRRPRRIHHTLSVRERSLSLRERVRVGGVVCSLSREPLSKM